MTLKMNKGDAPQEPDSRENDRFISHEWISSCGSLIETTIDPACWHNSLIKDLQKRGPVMLDHISSLLSTNPKTVSLLLCADDDIREMNHLYRGFDQVTNVLAFPSDHDLQWSFDIPKSEKTIGDIAIAGQTVLNEAMKSGITARDHLLHLFTHAVLHLLGYDHDHDIAAIEMEELEVHLLALMKVGNPYRNDDQIFGAQEAR